MFNKMEQDRVSPAQWSEMKIKTISKPGSALLMDNKRGLFIIDTVSKVYERILKNRNSVQTGNYLSDYQVGGVKMRSTNDCIFLLSIL